MQLTHEINNKSLLLFKNVFILLFIPLKLFICSLVLICSRDVVKTEFLRLFCVNCNNLIQVDEVELHSNFCIHVKKENQGLELNNNIEQTFETINRKLSKLYEHIVFLKETSELFKDNDWQIILRKEMHYYIFILEYISDARNINTITSEASISLKKLIINIDYISSNFKGSIETMTLIDRTLLLILEKLKVVNDELNRLNDIKHLLNNNLSTNGIIGDNSEYVFTEQTQQNVTTQQTQETLQTLNTQRTTDWLNEDNKIMNKGNIKVVNGKNENENNDGRVIMTNENLMTNENNEVLMTYENNENNWDNIELIRNGINNVDNNIRHTTNNISSENNNKKLEINSKNGNHN